jgi:hypothetical protein
VSSFDGFEESIRNRLRANLFDGDEGGTVTMSISDLLDQATEIVADLIDEIL